MASIIVMTGPQEGAYYPLGRRTNVIGRDEALLIQILDERVSRKHLQIRFDQEKGRYYAHDMKSKHGVLVNGAKVNKETELGDNSYIKIGETILFFTLKDLPDRENALSYYKQVSERDISTLF